jgi:hypothetical protein
MTNQSAVPAGRLRTGDLVVDGTVARRIESIRLQGAPAEAVVELHGLAARRHYRIDSPVVVLGPVA